MLGRIRDVKTAGNPNLILDTFVSKLQDIHRFERGDEFELPDWVTGVLNMSAWEQRIIEGIGMISIFAAVLERTTSSTAPFYKVLIYECSGLCLVS